MEDGIAEEGLRRLVADGDKARNGRTGRLVPRFAARIEGANGFGRCHQEHIEQPACCERGECGRPWQKSIPDAAEGRARRFRLGPHGSVLLKGACPGIPRLLYPETRLANVKRFTQAVFELR
jgi:hypothetical protein